MSKRQLRKDLRAVQERYLEIRDSTNPEDVEEVRRLMRQHEHLRLELLDYGEHA